MNLGNEIKLYFLSLQQTIETKKFGIIINLHLGIYLEFLYQSLIIP